MAFGSWAKRRGQVLIIPSNHAHLGPGVTTMLPTPVSYHSKRDSKYRSHRRLRDVLLTRARVTNLAVCMLAAFAGVSFFINLTYYFFPNSPNHPLADLSSPNSILVTVARDTALRSMEHLVIVPGHAIWEGSRPDDTFDEYSWLMESFQHGDKSARIQAYYDHIVRG